ncbi:MAG: hypothetical protein DA443_09530 [Bacteroidetes bacterium]|nr:MAG: hypothetical protein DA443_09530 [Bacteroidota bacterium]
MVSIRCLIITSLLLLNCTIASNAQDSTGDLPAGVDVQSLTNQLQAEGLTPSDIVSKARSMGLSTEQIRSMQMNLQSNRSSNIESSPEAFTQEEQVTLSPSSTPSTVRSNNFSGSVTLEGLELFGSTFFGSSNNAFEAAFRIPTPMNYQLGPGDQLVINIWGAAEARYALTINEEGLIRISGIGPVYLNGLTVEQARDRLMVQLKRIYSGLEKRDESKKDTYADISLGAARTIMITVIGEAMRPGTYSISSLSTVFNALYVTGGPSKKGSFREIEIIRNNQVISTLDLYDFILNGDLSGNIRLLDQDIIKINPYKKHIYLSGEVKRPAVFELYREEKLGDLINYAAGFTDKAYTKRFTIERFTDFQRRLEDVGWPEDSEKELFDGDRIKIGRILDRYENRVTIQGAVFKPGSYELEEGMSVADLIMKAEGFREDVFMNRALLTRTRNNYQKEVFSFPLHSFFGQKQEIDSTANMLLQKDDLLRIYSAADLQDVSSIRVLGAVKNSGDIPYSDGLSLDDVILMAGGFTYGAANYNIEIARFVSETDPYEKENELIKSFFFEVDDELIQEMSEFMLRPFDVITVREKPNSQRLGTIQISGEVNFPGSYLLQTRTDRISDIIRRSGDLSEFAYPEGATLQRSAMSNRALAQAEEVINEMVEFQRNDNIAIDLVAILDNPGSDDDLFLRSGDRIVIPRKSNTVTVEGQVLYPVTIRYDKGLKMDDYIRKAGGFTEMALKKNVYVIYADGDVEKVRRGLFGRRTPNIAPGATIIVPTKELEEELLPQERIGIYSAIISMAAIVTNTIFQIIR